MDRERLLRWLRRTALVTATLLLAAGALVYWLTATDDGFRRLLALTGRVPGVSIGVEGVRGTPASGFEVAHVTIDHERVHVEIEGLRARISPALLIGGTVGISRLEATAVRVGVKPPVRPPDHRPPNFVPSYLRITAEQILLGELVISDGTGTLFEGKNLRAGAGITRTRITVRHVLADAPGYSVGGDVALGSADPLSIGGSVAIVVPLEDDKLEATASLGGNLEHLAIDASLARPAGTRFKGLIDLTGRPAVDGTINLATTDLAPLMKDQPLGRLEGTLSVRGTLDAFTATGPVTAKAIPLGTLSLELDGGWSAGTFSFRRLVLAARGDGPRIEASGTVASRPQTMLAAKFSWQRLRWPLTGRADVESRSGSAEVSGGSPLSFSARTSLAGPRVPATDLEVRGTVDARRLDVAELRAKLLEGEVVAHGMASLGARPEWSFVASGRHLNPGLLRPQLAGRIDAALEASGRGFDPRGEWQAVLTKLSGRARGQAVSGHGSAAMHSGELALSQLHVDFGSLRATADGRLGSATGVELTADLGDLGDFLSDSGGSVHLHGRFASSGKSEQLRGSLEARHLRLGTQHIESLHVAADLDSTDHSASKLDLEAKNVLAGGLKIDAIAVDASGLAAGHQVRVSSRSGERHAEVHGLGTYAGGTETLRIDALDLAAPHLAHFALVEPSVLSLSGERTALDSTCVAADAMRLCGGGDWSGAKGWNASLSANHVRLDLLPLPLPAGTEYAGEISAEARLHGEPGALVTGEANANLEGAEFRYRLASGRVAAVRLGTGRFAAHAPSDVLALSADMRTTADSYVTIDARAQRSAQIDLLNSPLTGHVGLRTRELDLVPIVVRDLDRVAGLLEADIALGGTLGAPLLDGTLAFTDGEIDVYLSNLRLRQIKATTTLHGNALELDAAARAGDGQMAIKGQLAWSDGKPAGVVNFIGENLLVADLPEARVVASPSVTLRIAGNEIEVRGDVKIPSARIAPKDLSAAARVSGDQVIAGAPQSGPAEHVDVDSQIRVTVGPDVRIAAYGLKGLLQGSLTVASRGDGPVTGSGELEIKDGHYLAYARELDIERGRLIFSGGPVDDAALDIRASRQLPGYLAGVNVRGTLQHPQLSFFSDPALPQSQIASLLIVGQTTNSGQGGAGSMLAAQGGALLVGDYTHYLGIDQLTVEGDASNGTALVLGKFLSPRLYVSYGISLEQAINTLKLRYTIGDRWVLKAESGLNYSADLQYSFRR